MMKPFFLEARWHMVVALGSLALVAGCGGGGGSVGSTPAPAPSPTPTPTPAPTPTPTATPTSAFLTSEYNRSSGPAQHNAVAAWVSGYNGSGITIGIVDSGIDQTSPEFTGRIAGASRDVAGNRGLTNADSDHGTQVAMVAAAARDSTGVLGIAWNAIVAMFRADTVGSCATYDPAVPDSGCEFNDSDIAQGVNGAVAAGAKVINLSLGGSSPSIVLRSAVANAAASGVVVVISAGNDGDSTDPAKDPNNPDPFASGLRAAGNGNVIIAGSVDKDNVISTFSNKAGSEAAWFLDARGERVCCVYENGVLKVVTNADGTQSVYVVSGTSFAAPQIAGAAALLRQAFPNLTAVQVVDLLLRTAKDAGAIGTDPIYGRGILDIAAAFAPQGTTALAGSTVAMPLGDTTGVTSAPMGDATTRGAHLTAVVLDAYQRAYRVDLSAGLRAAQVPRRLAPALQQETRQISFGGDRLAMSFMVDGSRRAASLPWQGLLRLSRGDAEAARVLATRVAAQIAPHSRIAFAFAQGADGLVAQLQGQGQPAFLIARSPADDQGFAEQGQMAFAWRQQIGPWGLTALAERGTALSAAPVLSEATGLARIRSDRAQRFGLSLDRRFGTAGFALGLGWLNESRTMLGARLHEGFGPGGADSLLLDWSADWRPAQDWRLGVAARGAVTWPHAGGTLAPGARLLSSAWSVDLGREGLLEPGDVLALRLSQPLRVERGALNLLLPVSWSYTALEPGLAPSALSLTPRGREIDGELNWRGPLGPGTGMLSLFYRRDPGHYAALPGDFGLAASWSQRF